MVNTYIQLEDGQILNLSKDVIVPLNKGLNDIKDLSKRKGGFSKTIIVDGTKHNNNVLGHLYDVNIQATSFNPKVKVRCKLYQNNTQVFEGYIRLLKINKNNNSQYTTEEVVRYEMNIYDDTADFFNSVEGNLNNMDLSFLNHTWNAEEVINSQSYDYTRGYKYLFPRAFSDWNENTVDLIYNTDNNVVINIAFQSLSGGVRTYLVTTQAPHYFQETDVFQFSGLESNTLAGGNNWEDLNGVNFTVISVESETTFTIEITQFPNFQDPYLGGSGTVETLTIGDFAGIWDMHQFYPSFYARLYWDVIFTSAGYTYEFDLLDSELIKFNRLIIPSSIEGKIEKEDGWIAPYNNTGTNNYPFDNVEPIEQVGSVINLGLDSKGENPFLPSMSRKDFIKSIMTMFNLYLIPDENDPKKLIVKRRDDFYAEGENKDWTDKLDTSKTITIEDNPELGSSELEFTYTQGKEIDAVEYENVTGDVSGKQTIKFSDKNLKGTAKVEVKFNPFLNDQFVLGAKDPFIINTPYHPVSFEPYRSGDTCIVYDGVRTSDFVGVTNQLPCFIVNCNLEEGGQYNLNNVGNTEITDDSYQVVSHLDSWDNPLLDLNFGINRFYPLPINPFINVDNFTQNNLFNLHHRRTINQLDKGKLMTAYFNLNEVDFKEVKLNDRIWVRDKWWNIYNIKDYNANERKTTKVELLSIDEDSRINSFDTIRLPIKITKEDYLDGKINRYIDRIKDKKYTVQSTSELLEPNVILGGGNNVQGRGVVVLGKNNIVQPGVENTLIIGNNQTVSNSNAIVTENIVITEGIVEVATDITRADLLTLKNNNELLEGNTYYITDKNIWVKALSNNNLSPSAIGAKTAPSNTYYTISGINKGVFNANEPVDVILGDIYVWGAKVWEVTTAGTGVVPDDSNNLPSANFTEIPLSNTTYYTTGLLSIKYDIVNDIVSEIKDNRGNVYRNDSDLWNISNDYWNETIVGNTTRLGILNNRVTSIVRNSTFLIQQNTNNGVISDNSNKGSISINSNNGYISDNSNDGDIIGNSNSGLIGLNSNGGDIENNSNDGFILLNRNQADITNNSNDGNIAYNDNKGGILTNSNISDIENNNNNGGIAFNENSGTITRNSNNGVISFNENSGNIDTNNNNSIITFNDNNGDIDFNSNGGTIDNNTNDGDISNNSNLLNIEDNDNGSSISFNGNLGSITNNSNSSSILNNSNNGDIDNNTNVGFISSNSNSRFITSNSNAGDIFLNNNNGEINNNSNDGFIQFNSNNGYIRFNSNDGNIQANVNNGVIQNNIPPTTNITDPILNK